MDHPLCCMCAQQGKVTPATVVDHIIPHKGDAELFWAHDNWQPICKPCHDQHKQRAEKGGGLMGCDKEGVPLDPGHSWS